MKGNPHTGHRSRKEESNNIDETNPHDTAANQGDPR